MKLVSVVGKKGSGKSTVADMICRHYPKSKSIALADPIKHFAQEVFGFSNAQLYGPSSLRDAADPRFSITEPGFLLKIKNFFLSRKPPYSLHQAHVNRHHAHSQAVECLWRFLHDVHPHPQNYQHGRLLKEHLEALLDEPEISPRHVLQIIGTEWGREQVHPDIWVKHTLSNIETYYGSRAVLGFQSQDAVVISDCRFVNEAALIQNNGGVVIKVVRGGLSKDAFSGHASEMELDSPEMANCIDIVIENDGSLEELQCKVIAILEDDNLWVSQS